MFVDKVEVVVKSGNGGAGAVSFLREKFVIAGGPDGGDGGDGGNVYFEVSPNCDTLSHFRGKNRYYAQNGSPGGKRNKTGKNGKDIVLIVPPGTEVRDKNTEELLLDLRDVGKTLFLRGGKGGLGNVHFKNATNQAPTYAQKGIAGIEASLILELKLIANVGLVGFPNVGKSTLIATISNARPKIANYAFTTLIPSLGVVDCGDYHSFVMADIPGIIEGASEGKGLGLEFLRHIERTRFLLFVLDFAGELGAQFHALRYELQNFSPSLAQKPFGIVLSRADMLESRAQADVFADFLQSLGIAPNPLDSVPLSYIAPERWEQAPQQQSPAFVLPISSLAHHNTETLRFLLGRCLKQ